MRKVFVFILLITINVFSNNIKLSNNVVKYKCEESLYFANKIKKYINQDLHTILKKLKIGDLEEYAIFNSYLFSCKEDLYTEINNTKAVNTFINNFTNFYGKVIKSYSSHIKEYLIHDCKKVNKKIKNIKILLNYGGILFAEYYDYTNVDFVVDYKAHLFELFKIIYKNKDIYKNASYSKYKTLSKNIFKVILKKKNICQAIKEFHYQEIMPKVLNNNYNINYSNIYEYLDYIGIEDYYLNNCNGIEIKNYENFKNKVLTFIYEKNRNILDNILFSISNNIIKIYEENNIDRKNYLKPVLDYFKLYALYNNTKTYTLISNQTLVNDDIFYYIFDVAEEGFELLEKIKTIKLRCNLIKNRY